MPYAGQVFIAMKREYIDLKLLYSCNGIFSLCLLWADRKYILFMFSFSKVLAAEIREPRASKKGLAFFLFSLFSYLFFIFLDNQAATKQTVSAWLTIGGAFPSKPRWPGWQQPPPPPLADRSSHAPQWKADTTGSQSPLRFCCRSSTPDKTLALRCPESQ